VQRTLFINQCIAQAIVGMARRAEIRVLVFQHTDSVFFVLQRGDSHACHQAERDRELRRAKKIVEGTNKKHYACMM
jgi:dihydrodipicolinate synthase/N-acetylneuraminate lyase